MHLEISQRRGKILLLGITLLCAGCSGQGTGDTVASPPRDLVEKSFHPPANAVQPGAAAPTTTDSSPAPTGK